MHIRSILSQRTLGLTLVVIGTFSMAACKRSASSTTTKGAESSESSTDDDPGTPDSADGAAVSATVTWYKQGEMPVECPAPKGVDRHMAIAVSETSPLIDGAGCGGGSSVASYTGGSPDCSPVLKKLCGRTFEIEYKGTTKIGYLSGICPVNHPNNKPKGKWNPCSGDHTHLDLMQAMYDALGLDEQKNSWGENGTTGTVNPSAAYVSVKVKSRGGNLTPCTYAKDGCAKDVFPH